MAAGMCPPLASHGFLFQQSKGAAAATPTRLGASSRSPLLLSKEAKPSHCFGPPVTLLPEGTTAWTLSFGSSYACRELSFSHMLFVTRMRTLAQGKDS